MYWVKYRDIDCSRAAKRKMDNCPFFSNLLHVCYAPEFENMGEVRDKLEQRRLTISRKLKQCKLTNYDMAITSSWIYNLFFAIDVNNHKKTDSELIASSSHQSNASSSPIATSVVHSEEFVTNHSNSSKPLFPLLPMPPVVMATSQMTSPFVSNNELHIGLPGNRLPGNTHARLHSLADIVHSTTPSNTCGTTPSNTSGTTPDKRRGENFPDITTENQKTSSIGLSLEVRKELHQSHITPKVRWEREGDLDGQQSSVKLVVSSVQKTDICSEQKGKSRKRRDGDNFFNLHDQTHSSDGSPEGGMYAQKSNIVRYCILSYPMSCAVDGVIHTFQFCILYTSTSHMSTVPPCITLSNHTQETRQLIGL